MLKIRPFNCIILAVLINLPSQFVLSEENPECSRIKQQLIADFIKYTREELNQSALSLTVDNAKASIPENCSVLTQQIHSIKKEDFEKLQIKEEVSNTPSNAPELAPPLLHSNNDSKY